MEQRSAGTHDGTFHADEVTACALLLAFDLIDRDKILRSRDLSKIDQCEYVCDVGGIYNPQAKRFDHHQNDYKGDLASAGMVALYLKDRNFIDQKFYDFLNRSFICGVDAHDNGRVTIEPGVCTFSMVISNFVPPDYEVSSEEMTKAFFRALEFAEGHVRRVLDRYGYVEDCREAVSKAMKQGGPVLLFEKAMPWLDVFFDMDGERHPAQFVIMPSGNHWKLRGIPPNSKDRMKVRIPLPESWAGLMGEELKKASGISGAVFCHKGRFISVWETKDDALKALNLILRRK
jgi:uncharacterized UPF0160 family protein